MKIQFCYEICFHVPFLSVLCYLMWIYFYFYFNFQIFNFGTFNQYYIEDSKYFVLKIVCFIIVLQVWTDCVCSSETVSLSSTGEYQGKTIISNHFIIIIIDCR